MDSHVHAIERVIGNRRSVRGFRPDQVPPDVLEHVFGVAQRAPSNCNVQPWRVFVASGDSRDRIRAALLERVTGGERGKPDFSGSNKFKGGYRKLQIECAIALYDEMGITMEDRPGRRAAGLRNYELFDAPHVAFIGMDRSFGFTVAIDVGIYLQTLMLTMTAHVIACCPQGALRDHPDLVRAHFNAPEEIGILCGMSFGYEDKAVPANRTRTTRSPLTNNVVFDT